MAITAQRVEVDLAGRLDDRDIKAYKRHLEDVRQTVARKDQFRAQLGADFDARAFRAFERDLAKARVAAARPITQELKVNSDTRGIREFHRATGDVQKALGDLNRQAAATRNIIALLRWPALITGAGLAAQAVSTLTAAATALGSALAPLSGLLAAAPAAASAAGQGLGVFKLATSGVADALTAAGKASSTAGIAAVSSSKQQASAADAVKAAQDRVASADAGLGRAHDDLARANEHVRETQEALTQAQADARRELIDLRFAAEGAALSVESAQIALERARERAGHVAADPAATLLDERDAALAVQEAELRLREARSENVRAQADNNRAQKEGVQGAQRVVEAQKSVRDAHEGVAAAQQSVSSASRAAAAAQRAVAASQRQVASASQATTPPIDRFAQAMAKLPPAAQQFVRTLLRLKPELDELRRVSAAGLFPGAERGILAANKNFGVLRDGVARTSVVIGDLAEKAGRLVGSRAFGRDLETQLRRNDVLIRRSGEGSLHLANALRNVTIAAGPLVDWLSRMALRFTTVVDQQVATARHTGLLAKLFDETRVAMSRVVRIGADLATAFFNIARAGKPLGDEILVSLVKSADAFREWTDSARGQNAIAKYFQDARPGIFEAGRLTRDIVKAFFQLGTGSHIAPLLRQMRTELVPTLADVLETTTRSFGPVLLNALTQALVLFGHLADSSGPLVAFTKLLAQGLYVVNQIIDRVPVIGTALTTIVSAGGLYGALRIGAAVTGISSVIKLLGVARGLTGAAGVAGAAGTAAGAGAAVGVAGKAAGGAAEGGILAGLIRKFGARGAAARAGGAGLAVDVAINLKTSKGNVIATAINTAHDITFGIVPKVKVRDEASDGLKKIADQADRLAKRKDWSGLDELGKKVRANATEARAWGNAKLADRYDDLGRSVQRLARTSTGEFGRVRDALEEARQKFTDLRRYGNDDLNSIRKVTRENTRDIREKMGTNTAAGKEAVARNFRAARNAVRESMDASRTSVRSGLAEIQKLMRAELKAYGLSGAQINATLGTRNAAGSFERDTASERSNPGGGKARGGFVRRFARGGWIGQPGEAGHDDVLIAPGTVAARGEFHAAGPTHDAVLSRHQQPFADLALMATGGITLTDLAARGAGTDQVGVLDRALATVGMGGLRGLFGMVTRPHYLAQGGAVNLMGAKAGLAGYAQFARQFGLTVVSGLRPGAITSSGNVSQHSSGDAIDVDAGPPAKMLAYARAMVQRFGAGLDQLIHTPLGYGINRGRKVPLSFFGSTVNAQHHDHVHVGDSTPTGGGGLAGGLAKIRAPVVRGGGALGQVVQGALSAAARGATRRANDLIGLAPVNPGAHGGGRTSAGGQYDKAALMALWRRAGGPANVANIAAAIALAESGGNPNARNPSGASGLWQILGAVLPGNLNDPLTNARNAVAKWRAAKGFTPWTVFTGADTPGHAKTYLQYLAGGGFARYRAPRSKAFGGGAGSAGTSLRIRGLKALQTDRIADFDALLEDVSGDQRKYQQTDRAYNMSEEVLLRDDGTVDEGAVKQRARELLNLQKIRERIMRELRKAEEIAKRVVRSYTTILSRLSRSLRHARGKDRAGVRAQITDYQGRLTEWRGKAKDLGFDVEDARLDVVEIGKERAEVLGTRADVQASAADVVADAAADTGTTPDAGEPAQAPPTPEQIAAAAAVEVAAFQSARAALFGTGSNFLSRAQALAPGGAFSGAPDATTLAAGGRYFGAAGGGPGAFGNGAPVTITNNYHQLPDNTQTWAQQMRFQVSNAA